MKSLRVWIILILLTAVVLGCTTQTPAPTNTSAPPPPAQDTQAPPSGDEQPQEGKASQNWKIAFIPQLIGIPYFTAMEEGGNDAAEAFGVTYLNVGSPTANAAEQVRLMENLIQQRVDAISISVLDSASLNPVMERAEQAGIKVYTSDSDSPNSVRRVYVA